jgi:membrane protein implicated in regulation of membrane protease activity
MLPIIGWAVALIGSLAAFAFIQDATVVWVSLWVAAGAFAALVTSVLNLPFVFQLIVFLLVMGIFLFLLRPSFRKRFPITVQPTNTDLLLGQYAPVTAAIDNLAGVGQVKVNGMEWSARSTDGQPIEEGTVVCIHHIEGVKLFVFPVVDDFNLD